MAKISATARITPESTVRIWGDFVREFISPLPSAKGELQVKSVRLREDGWRVELYGYPGQFFLEAAFEVLKLAPLGEQQEIPGLKTFIEHEAAKFEVPPGFEMVLNPEGSIHG